MLPPDQQAIRVKCFHPSGTFLEFPIEDVETSIPARFEKIARLHADRIALKTDLAAVTYSQLNDLANRCARALLRRHERRIGLVAVLLEKDVAQIAAMLGVMKAGKFFLILDPTFPKARLASMLQGSGAKLILTDRRHAYLAHEICDFDCELMRWEELDNLATDKDPTVLVAPKNLAFINYTSGSTGEPKGLLRTHRMILHNIMLRTNLVHVCAQDHISLLSSGTSNAITNSLLALLNGAALHLFEVKKDGVVKLARWLADEGITIAPMSSPLFRSVCEVLEGKNNFPRLRAIRLRSEAVYASDVELYKRHFAPTCIFVTGLSSNETGPLADFLIDHDTALSEGAIPVGYAASGKEIVLLNEHGKELDFGEVGEIAVRSHYLSPGYLRNPRLTREKFRRDPKKPRSRIYLTGDMGLILIDGCLILMGRKDFRVKIRGYPVDLREVETALRAHASLRDAVVVARSTPSKETALVAYFVAASQESPTISELRRFLRRTLPDYMIPGAFVRLGRMPLNPQNKVDRAALPTPPEARPDLDIPFMTPRSDEEREIAAIWAEVLGVDHVGIQDKFFDLGGHSLAASRIVTRVNEQFSREIPLQLLFESPTVEKMAALIVAHSRDSHEAAKPHGDASASALSAGPAETTVEDGGFPKKEVEQSILERFEKIVRLYSDRTAVKTSNDAVTYAQLNAMANRMARTLIEHQGVQPEPVAILLKNGPRLLAAMLAVLKAGKFFILLDGEAPKAKIGAVMEDSQANSIIADSHEHDLRELERPTCALFTFDAISTEDSKENFPVNLSAQTLAGIFYTSGSTGESKGVLWAHRNLLHQVMLFTNAYRLSERDRVLLTTSGTGNAVTIAFLALLNGATLLPFEIREQGLGRLAQWIVEEKITICWLGSPLFRELCRAMSDPTVFTDARILRLSSEASYKRDLELYRKHFSPKCTLFNGLSASEAGLICLNPIDFNSVFSGENIPVGAPVEDKEVILLDDSGREVGFLEVGEIVVRSQYLSPGYWRRPELTAQKFVTDPENTDRRLYFSGDLGVRLPDGSLIHKGRKDFRVKIRGYGVELAEVEQALACHPSVRQAIVIARDNGREEVRLIAYLTCAEPAPDASALREFLKTRLADFMIPAAFVLLAAFPLTSSGKIDRRALPAPHKGRPHLTTAYRPPGNEFEQKLGSIWEDVLDVHPIGVHDDFFDLGGDSLSAARVLSKIVKQFQFEASLSSLFQSPTLAEMARIIADQRGELSEQQNYADRFFAPPSAMPLSYSQQRLWFLDQLEPGSCTYNLFSAYRLKGTLHPEVLEHSFNEIIRRHEILRTVFEAEDGKPAQVVLPRLAIKIPLIDLKSFERAEEQWTEARRIFTEEAQLPFDLTSGPLLRITLLRLADDEHIMLRTIHHIVYDGWSEAVLFRELAQIYGAQLAGTPALLPNPPVQYVDYANWQRHSLQVERHTSQLLYWKKQLANLVSLDLPTDTQRSAGRVRRGMRRYFELSNRLTSDIKRLSREHHATLFMTLLAGFEALLHRYTDQTDIAVGSSVAGRTVKEFEQSIGFFLNLVVLRLDFSGDPTFVEMIRRARNVCLDALSNQDVPFEKVVEELHPDRNAGQYPLFDVSFAFQNSPRAQSHLPSIAVDQLEVDAAIARFDLHLFMEEIDGRLKGYFDFDLRLFHPETAASMVGHFETLLKNCVRKPNKRISGLSIFSDAEQRQLLSQWNKTGAKFPECKRIHELFQTEAEKTPDAIAVVFENQRLTYHQLNSRANQLAGYLQSLGVGPGTYVGICLERCPDLVVALLGVLKCGGAYIPLDSSYPEERLHYMLKHGKASVLLTSRGISRQLPVSSCRTVYLDEQWQEISRHHSSANLAVRNDFADTAYVIYTSGSTGRPKGVMVPHGAIANHMAWMIDAFKFTSQDRIAQRTPFSFDASAWEFFAPLLSGGRLVLTQPDGYSDAEYLVNFVEKHQISILQVSPTLLRMLLEQELARCTSLKRVFSGGEPLSAELSKEFRRKLGIPLINLYGPTEATIDATYYDCSAQEAPAQIPIGRPIANTRVYILDSHLKPVPIGVCGEIFIAGAGLALGYLDEPERTAEKFLPDPFTDEPGSRMYASGDRARYRRDGNIEFIGRADQQVKLRGYRIELGEIETILRQHTAVGECVAAILSADSDDKRLVVYVAGRPGELLVVADLKEWLKRKLPAFMIPSAWVQLAQFPLLPNGKIDRNGLPAPEVNRLDSENLYHPPTTALETALADIWSAVLKSPRIGIHDDFFELGGHSLLATQIVSRIRSSLSIDLPLRAMFEAPTIAELARVLQGRHFKSSENLELAQTLDELESMSEAQSEDLLRADQS